MNSYQKLKKKHAEEIAKLHADIQALMQPQDSMLYIITRERWRIYYQMQDVLWQGSNTESGNGFVDLISFNDKNDKLLKIGTKIKLTKVHENSTSKVGDVFNVTHCYFNRYFNIEPVVCFINANGHKSRISKQKGKWDYIVVNELHEQK